jgi:predicted transcriptional regulator
MGIRGEGLTVLEEEKIKVMAAEGHTYHAIGKALQRSPHTIKKYLTGDPATVVEVQEKRRELADIYEDLAREMLSNIGKEDIAKINAYQRTLSAAVATDKMRLLRDQSTINAALLIDMIYDIRRAGEL